MIDSFEDSMNQKGRSVARCPKTPLLN